MPPRATPGARCDLQKPAVGSKDGPKEGQVRCPGPAPIKTHHSPAPGRRSRTTHAAGRCILVPASSLYSPRAPVPSPILLRGRCFLTCLTWTEGFATGRASGTRLAIMGLSLRCPALPRRSVVAVPAPPGPARPGPARRCASEAGLLVRVPMGCPARPGAGCA